MRQVLSASGLLFALAGANLAFGQTEVDVGAGQTLTESDLASGVFEGQDFALGRETTFNINSGGVIGPIGDFFTGGFDFAGSTVNVNSGGFFASTDPDPMLPFVQSNVTNVGLNLADGGVIAENFFVFGDSTVNISGGTTGGNLAIFDGSVANISGGVVGDLLSAFPGGQINISGGIIGDDVVAQDFSELNISGGTFGSFITTFDGSVTNISGGSIGDEFVAFEGAEVNLFVTSLRIDGQLVDLTLGEALLIDQRGGALLEATLADGSFLDFSLNGTFVSSSDVFEFGTALTVTLVPAPNAVVMLGIGGVLVARRRRL